jgi:hypothetical protein
MSEYVPWEPTTADIRERYSDWYDGVNAPPTEVAEAEFDRWLEQIKADAWQEGFNAGERDVWEHQHGEAGEDWDKDCIPNPYLKGETSVSKFGHNPLCQQAMDIDPDVTACICDWVDAAERDTEGRLIKLLEKEREKHIPWCGDVQPCPKCHQTMGLETAITVIQGEK